MGVKYDNFDILLRNSPPIDLHPGDIAPYSAWERGFDSFDAGIPFTHGTVEGRLQHQWESGWRASEAMERLTQ